MTAENKTMPKEEFTIRRRALWEYLGKIRVEIECDPTSPHSVKLGLAVRVAVKSRANLSGADLSGAYLSRADLSGAYLPEADLSGADLSGADLSGAYLSRANLPEADLSGADLSGADLSDEDLRPFKADLWLTLSELKTGAAEALHLIHKLQAGEVDGSTYDGNGDRPCACLVGTIAQAKNVSGEELDHNSSRPAERWFMMIRPGDKPESETGGGFAARKALEWAKGWCVAHGISVQAQAA